MGSIQAAVRSVFGGKGAEVLGLQTLPRAWPIFQLVPTPAGKRRGEDLISVVEGEIIPRLVVAHHSAPAEWNTFANSPDSHEKTLSAAVLETFARLTLSRSIQSLEEFLRDAVEKADSVEEVYSQLMAPTARFLIDLWSRDRISYTEVTIALGRLQHLLRELDSVTPYNGQSDPGGRSAFFTPRPGEQQTFGFYIFEEQFRWSGWQTWIETSATMAEINASLAAQWFDLFCMSVTRDAHMEEVSETIAGVRRASRNRDMFVLVNGRPFIDHPGLIDFVGADAAAADGDEALDMVDHAIGRHAA